MVEPRPEHDHAGDRHCEPECDEAARARHRAPVQRQNGDRDDRRDDEDDLAEIAGQFAERIGVAVEDRQEIGVDEGVPLADRRISDGGERGGQHREGDQGDAVSDEAAGLLRARQSSKSSHRPRNSPSNTTEYLICSATPTSAIAARPARACRAVPAARRRSSADCRRPATARPVRRAGRTRGYMPARSRWRRRRIRRGSRGGRRAPRWRPGWRAPSPDRPRCRRESRARRGGRRAGTGRRASGPTHPRTAAGRATARCR